MASTNRFVNKVFVAFGTFFDVLGISVWEEADCQLLWLNNLWAMAYEDGDASYKTQHAYIEEAHDAIGVYFSNHMVWKRYLVAYQQLVDTDEDDNDL